MDKLLCFGAAVCAKKVQVCNFTVQPSVKAEKKK